MSDNERLTNPNLSNASALTARLMPPVMSLTLVSRVSGSLRSRLGYLTPRGRHPALTGGIDHSAARMTANPGLENGLLLRTLTDPDTGLPSVLYFRLVRDWEERRAARHGGRVRTVRIIVRGGDDTASRRFTFGLCREFRKSDLIASSGRGQYRLLLVGRDADQGDAIRSRVDRLRDDANGRSTPGGSIDVQVTLDAAGLLRERDAHEPPDLAQLEDTGSGPRFDLPETSQPND